MNQIEESVRGEQKSKKITMLKEK